MSGHKEIVLSEGTLEAWCHLSPVGVFMGKLDGKPVRQVCDMEAFGRVIAAFEPEVLVDFEHRAENSDDTTAAGWVQELRASGEGGLEARIRFTDLGTEAVRNRRLRFLSPVWPLGADGRPEALRSAALTNTPNFNLRPVLNKATAGAEPQMKGEVRMIKFAKLFGLPETATEDEILAAATAKAEEQAALAKRVAELEKTALEAEAEGAYEENKENIANKEAFIACFVQNKAATAATLATFKKPVCNKAAAKSPSFSQHGTPAARNTYTEWSAMPPGAAKDSFLRANAEAINLSAPAEQ